MEESKRRRSKKRISSRRYLGYILNRYALFTLMAFLIIGIPATIYFSNIVTTLFIQAFADSSAANVEAIFETATDGKPINEPLEGKEKEKFTTFFDELKQHTDFNEIAVWAKDGTLVYSSNPKAPLGEKRPKNGGFAEALKNKKVTEIEHNAKLEVEGGQKIGTSLEVYFPIHDKSEENITNVFEIYAPLTSIEKTVNTARNALISFFVSLLVVVAVIAQTGGAILKRKNDDLSDLTEKLAVLADTDGLTGAYNHRFFVEALTSELSRSSRYDIDMGLIMLDLDFFKSVNDFFGHPAGDKVLIEVVSTLKASLRSMDIVARYGGEEFVIILPESNAVKTMEVAERLRKKIEELVVEINGEKITITASFGVADYPDCNEDADELVAAADSSLFMAKGSGKNRVHYFKNIDDTTLKMNEIESLFSRLQYANLMTIQALAAAVKGKKDQQLDLTDYTYELVRETSRKLSLGKKETETLLAASTVYDIGKLTIPQEIFVKGQPLTDSDQQLIHDHPETGKRILQYVKGMEDLLSIVKYHHEKFDGTGYPEGLKGEKIPYLARVMHVIDAYSAMQSERPYRNTLTKKEAITELKVGAGSDYDPEIVEIFTKNLYDYKDY